MTRKIFGGTRTAALAALLVSAAALAMTAPPARAMQILEAADHGELAAEVSAAGVSRIALAGDRIRRVIRAPGGFAVEHDPGSGDLYLRPVAPELADGGPVTLFIGTELGFTYRLTLTPTVRDSAQILIRNADAAGCTVTGAAHGDLSSEKVYARLRTMTCAASGPGERPGSVIETEVAGFVAGSGKTGVRGPVVSREGALVEKAFLAGLMSGIGQGGCERLPAPGGGERRDRRGRQHRTRRHRPRGLGRRRRLGRAEGPRLHDPPRRAVPAGDPSPRRDPGDAGVPRGRPHRGNAPVRRPRRPIHPGRTVK